MSKTDDLGPHIYWQDVKKKGKPLCARITRRPKTYWLGTFDTVEQAREAVQEFYANEAKGFMPNNARTLAPLSKGA